MYDHRIPNGYPGLPPPSLFLDILLEIKEDMGGMKAGLRQSLANDTEIFDQIREMRDRMTTIEQRPGSGQLPTAKAGLLAGTTKLFKEATLFLMAAWRLAALAAWAITAATVGYNADTLVAIIRSLK